MVRPPKEKTSEYRSGHVALLGRPNVGKSTLLNAFIGERIAIVSHHPQTTRDRLLGVRTDEDAQIAFVDTPGLHAPINRLGMRMNREAQGAIEDADVLVFVTEVGKLTRSDLSRTDIAIIKGLPANTPSICVLNKIDRLADKARLIPLLQSIPRLHDFSAIVPICAKNDDGVERLLEEVKALLPKGPKLYDDDTLTDRPTRYLVAEFVREQILARTRAELPHGIAVTVTSYTEGEGKNKKAMPVVELTVHVPKESHKKMIIGKGGVVMKVVGTAARARIEELLGQSIVLKLWVRVTPRWFEDEHAMRELGYGEGEST